MPRTFLHRGAKRGQRGGTENKYQVIVHEFVLFFVQVYCHELYVRRHRGKMKNKTGARASAVIAQDFLPFLVRIICHEPVGIEGEKEKEKEGENPSARASAVIAQEFLPFLVRVYSHELYARRHR